MALLVCLVGCDDGSAGVQGANRPPTLEVPVSAVTREGEATTFTVVASDPDDDPLTLEAFSLPRGATFEKQAGVFAWVPPYDAAGSYVISFSASDGLLTAQGTVAVTVFDVNQKPVLVLPGTQSVNEGELLTFEVLATDQDTEDVLTISSPNKPDGATLTGKSFAWTPSLTQQGTHNVGFVVNDNHQLSQSETVTGQVTIIVYDASCIRSDQCTDGRICTQQGVCAACTSDLQCPNGHWCTSGKCTACNSAGAPVDTQNEVANCGSCGHACPTPANAAALCALGECGRGPCEPGYFDLDGNFGCEAQCTNRVCTGPSGSVTVTNDPLPETGVVFQALSSAGNYGAAQSGAGFTNVGVLGEPTPPGVGGAVEQANTNFKNVGGVNAVLRQ